jgi:hypothetical protein
MTLETGLALPPIPQPWKAQRYGRDATTALGKFEIEQAVAPEWSKRGRTSHYWLTLAPCQPNPEELVAEGCYYTVHQGYAPVRPLHLEPAQ